MLMLMVTRNLSMIWNTVEYLNNVIDAESIQIRMKNVELDEQQQQHKNP